MTNRLDNESVCSDHIETPEECYRIATRDLGHRQVREHAHRLNQL